MIIHCHHSFRPNSGEMKRILNINRDVAGVLSAEIVEVEFFSWRDIRFVLSDAGQFTLSDTVVKKYYIPHIARLGILDEWFQSLLLFFLMLRHRPNWYLEEWFLPRGNRWLKKLFSCRWLVDIHGAAPEEYSYIHHKRSSYLERRERHTVYSADGILCQSDEMERHLSVKYPGSAPAIVYRCGVDMTLFHLNEEKRRALRDDLSYRDKNIVFVYSGGMHPWQKVDGVLRFFQQLHAIDACTRLLVLTRETDAFMSYLHRAGYENLPDFIKVLSLSYEQVPDYLNASDAAFLMRDDVVMNAVASPTKLAEYFACGLPVITSSVAQHWLDEEGMRYVYDTEKFPIEKVFSFVHNLNRSEISDYAQCKLSLEMDRTRVLNALVDNNERPSL